MAPGSAPDDPVRGLVPCFFPPRLLHPRASFLTYSLCCLGCSSPWHRVLPRTIQSGGSGRAPLRPGCSSPGRLFDVFSPLPWTLQSVAPGSAPDDPVRGLVPASFRPGCSIPGRLFCVFSPLPPMLQSVAPGSPPDDTVRGLGPCSSPAPPRSAVLGTLSRAAVRRVLCALPGFAAPGGRCGLAPVLMPWLWPAACLSGVPRGPALVRRSSSGPVALGAPVGFPVAVVPSPTPGALAPGFTGWLRGARGGRPRTGLMCLPLAPAEARALGALRVVPVRGPAMGLSLAGPSGLGLGLRVLRWLGVCGPGHCRVRFPVPSVLRRGTRPLHRGCFVWTPTPPLLGRRTPRPGPARVCVCVPCLAGSGSWPPGRVLVRLTFPLAVLGSLFACSAPSGLGSPCFWLLLVSFFFFPFPLPPPRCALVVSSFACFPGPCALGLGVLSPPPFFLPPPLVVSGASCFPVVRGLCAPPLFFFFLSCFSFFGFFLFFAGCAVRGGFVCLWPSVVPACASVVLSLSLVTVRWLVLRGVRYWAWLSSVSPGGSWCRASVVLSSSGRVARRPVVRRGVSCCSAALCCVLLRCAVVSWCPVTLCCLFAPLPAPVVCFFLLRVCCVCSRVSCCVFPVLSALCGAVLRCAGALSLCCARRLCCFWWLVLLVPGVAAFCWGSAGGSGFPALSFGGVCRLGCPCLVWLLLGVFPVVFCSPVLCAVALCCLVVLCCGALSSSFFFSRCWWRWFPVVPRWFWALARFQVVSGSLLCPWPSRLLRRSC